MAAPGAARAGPGVLHVGEGDGEVFDADVVRTGAMLPEGGLPRQLHRHARGPHEGDGVALHGLDLDEPIDQTGLLRGTCQVGRRGRCDRGRAAGSQPAAAPRTPQGIVGRIVQAQAEHLARRQAGGGGEY